MSAVMSARLLSAIVLLVAMISAPLLARLARPMSAVAQGHDDRFNLETLVPRHFGKWRVDQGVVPFQVTPDVQAELDMIYSQVLARTYTDDRGHQIMLSIAYGGDQSDNLSIHLPEGCYGGQGFAVAPKSVGPLDTPRGRITVARLVATKQSRVEPITYWMVVANKVTTSTWEAKQAKLAYTLTGRIPSGILIRISSVVSATADAYEVQQDFAYALIAALPDEIAERFVGTIP
jgi:EpsI family protein